MQRNRAIALWLQSCPLAGRVAELELFAISAMDVSGLTWKGESIEDVEILRVLPADLVRARSDTNGFILRGGAVPSEKVSSRRP